MKKQILLLSILSSASVFANTLTSDIEVSKYITNDKQTGQGLVHRTNLKMELPYDLEFRGNLTYFSDFDKARFSLIGENGVETGVGLTKKFGKYGDVSLDVKLDKTARLGYHNRYQINDNNKIYGGLEYQHKFINQKRGLKHFYETSVLGANAKYDNGIHYDLMANSGKVYLGLESKFDTNFGKFDSDVKLSNIVQYDNVEVLYSNYYDENYITMHNDQPAPLKNAHKKVFSNQIELETKQKFTLNDVPVSFGLDTKTNVFVGRFNGDFKQDVLNVKSNIDAKVDYTYTKDTLKVIPELAIKNLVEVNDIKKYQVPVMNTDNIKLEYKDQHIEKLFYQLTLAPAVKVEKDLGKGLSVNGKVGVDVVFNKLETELNKSSQIQNENWKKFGYGYTNFKIGAGLKYTW